MGDECLLKALYSLCTVRTRNSTTVQKLHFCSCPKKNTCSAFHTCVAACCQSASECQQQALVSFQGHILSSHPSACSKVILYSQHKHTKYERDQSDVSIKSPGYHASAYIPCVSTGVSFAFNKHLHQLAVGGCFNVNGIHTSKQQPVAMSEIEHTKNRLQPYLQQMAIRNHSRKQELQQQNTQTKQDSNRDTLSLALTWYKLVLSQIGGHEREFQVYTLMTPFCVHNDFIDRQCQLKQD